MKIKFSHNSFFRYIPLPRPARKYCLPPVVALSDEEEEAALDKIFGKCTMTDEELEQSCKMAEERRKQKELELYDEFGIEPFVAPKHHDVCYFVMSEGELTLEESSAINYSLINILMAFDTFKPSHEMLWDIVNNKEGAGYYADCKYYDVDISTNGVSFLIDQSVYHPKYVKFTGEFIRAFLWAYLTMRESPAAPFSMEVSFKKNWVIFE